MALNVAKQLTGAVLRLAVLMLIVPVSPSEDQDSPIKPAPMNTKIASPRTFCFFCTYINIGIKIS